MQTETYKVKGMHCASCAGIIEKTFKKIDGVSRAEVNYGTEAAKISYNKQKTNPERLSKEIEKYGYTLLIPTASEMYMSADEHAAHLGLSQSKQERLNEIRAMKVKVISAIPLAVISIVMMVWDILIKYDFDRISFKRLFSKSKLSLAFFNSASVLSCLA